MSPSVTSWVFSICSLNPLVTFARWLARNSATARDPRAFAARSSSAWSALMTPNVYV